MVDLHLPAVMKYIIGLGGHTFLHYTEMSNRVGRLYTRHPKGCLFHTLLAVRSQTSINGRGRISQWVSPSRHFSKDLHVLSTFYLDMLSHMHPYGW